MADDDPSYAPNHQPAPAMKPRPAAELRYHVRPAVCVARYGTVADGLTLRR
jgi:hypothetical protein